MDKKELEKILKEFAEENNVNEIEVNIINLYKGKKVEVKCR